MQYVLSQRMDSYQHDRLKVVREDPAQFVRELKERDGGPIYLCGGGSLAGYLLDHELVDELILKLHPVVFGAGVRLFGGSRKELGSSLVSTTVYHNGVVYLHYVLRYTGMAAGS
jgi:dihydrofolate reductase